MSQCFVYRGVQEQFVGRSVVAIEDGRGGHVLFPVGSSTLVARLRPGTLDAMLHDGRLVRLTPYDIDAPPA